jgi:hypothetical protein
LEKDEQGCLSPKLRESAKSTIYRGRCKERLCYKSRLMIAFLISLPTCLSSFFRSRYNLSLEILALRQQLRVLKRKHPRPRLQTQDRMFWTLLRGLWPAWSNALVIVKPETVVAWHRAGFCLFWRLRSRPKSVGRRKIDAEIRALIRRMAEENKGYVK